MSAGLSVGQIFGSLILGVTVLIPGLALGGFHGGTSWSIFGWLCVSIVGGFVGGLLMAPSHRIAGAIGGMIGAPCALLALYLYSKDRNRIFRAEACIVSLVGGSPGFAIFFILRLLGDALFPARPREEDDEDYDDEDDDDRPRRKRRREIVDDEEEEAPRKKRKRPRDDEDDDRPRSPRRYDADDEPGGRRRRLDED